MVRGLSNKQILESIKRCKRFLENIYGNDITNRKEWGEFDVNKIHFSKTSERGVFYKGGVPRGHKDKIIWIGLRNSELWSTYCRKTKLGLMTPCQGVKLPSKQLGFERTLVHELTHFIQHLQGRCGRDAILNLFRKHE